MKNQVATLDLLLSRLRWPSGMVRERACVALAELLQYPALKDDVANGLHAWIQVQECETYAASGLLPFVRASRDEAEIGVLKRAWPGLNRRSLLAFEILNHAGLQIDDPNAFLIHSGDAPGSFRPPDFFDRNMRTGLPPLYAFEAARIEFAFRIPFIHQWGYEWNELVVKSGHPTSENVYGFHGRDDAEHYRSIDFWVMDIYKSSYLRSLAWAVQTGRMSLNDGRYLASKVCPLNLDLWMIAPSSRPSWWPEPPQVYASLTDMTRGIMISPVSAAPRAAPAASCDSVQESGMPEVESNLDEEAKNHGPAGIWEQIQGLWDSRAKRENCEWEIGAAEGRIGAGDTLCYLSIIGCLQVSNGPEAPDADELWEWVDNRHIRLQQDSQLGVSGAVVEDPERCPYLRTGNSDVLPVGVHAYPTSIPWWQPWRVSHLWLPSVSFAPYSVGLREGDLSMSTDAGPLGEWSDWTHNLTEMAIADAPASAGQVLMIRNEALAGQGGRYCWLCHVKFLARRGWGKYEEFEMSRMIGASVLVLPG